ncbi:MAG: C-GCAxxG-C-C family protein [bacterium]
MDKQGLANKAFEEAKAFELRSGGCAQSTLFGILKALDIKDEKVFMVATGFADGVGLTGDGHCGALSGGVMAISYFFGRNYDNAGDIMAQLKACMLAKKLHDEFVAKYGIIRCADLQTKFMGRFYNLYDLEDVRAAIAAGMPEKCSNLVGEVAKMAITIILEEKEKIETNAS